MLNHCGVFRRAAPALLWLLLVQPLFAQSDRPQERQADTGRGAMGAKMPQAPVGHRQPTAADVANAGAVPKPDQEIEQDKRDRVLDSQLKICRGC